MREREVTKTGDVKEVAGLFLKLGFTAFGGPAAHIGLMHEEVVQRRRWIDDQGFLDLLGATNLIPGPNSTEMAIHLGFRRAGWRGLVAAGVCFVLPAMLIVLILSWAYVRFGALPQAQSLLYGIKPVMIAIIVHAIWALGKKAARNVPLLIAAVLILALYELVRVNEILLLFGGGCAVMLVANWSRLRQISFKGTLPVPLLAPILAPAAALSAVPFSVATLFLTFLKIGAILYGSGYVLLAFLRADFVVRLGWLTDRQLLDAIAIGQVSPGPLFTSATFIGYLLAGVPGGLLATLGIFLPSFLLVAVSNPLIPKMRGSPWVGSFLDGVNIASLSLMAAVTLQLGAAALIDVPTIVLAALALIALLRFRINTTWLIAASAVVGVLKAILQ
jgi:chromate transporter